MGPAASDLELHALSRDWSESTGQEQSVSWLVSGGLHLLAFLAFAWWWSPQPRGVQLTPDREVGIVLVGQVADRTEYFSPDDGANSDSADAATNAPPGSEGESWASALPGGDAPPVDPGGVLPAGPAPGSGLVGTRGLPGAGDLTQGGTVGAAGRVGANKGHTYVFGIQGVGNKFLYVFDRSASMEGYGGRPLAAAKAELIKSLEQLGSNHQFQIIFYNDRQTVFNPYAPQAARMLFAEDKHKDLAQRYVRSVTADGGTRHLEALRMALGLHPDVVFFLTDADEPQLSSAELADVARWAGGTVIHAIEFGVGPATRSDNFLVRLARNSGGQHVYVDVTQLPGP